MNGRPRAISRPAPAAWFVLLDELATFGQWLRELEGSPSPGVEDVGDRARESFDTPDPLAPAGEVVPQGGQA